MLRLLLFRFWPVLLPLLIYALWHRAARLRAEKTGATPPHFQDGPWYWAVFSSLLLAIVCFLFWGTEAIDGKKGSYVPPHMENGEIVPGQVKP